MDILNDGLTQRFASGLKQVILQPAPYVDRRFCSVLVEAELVCYLKYHVAQAYAYELNSVLMK
jgi:hypothetical protein